MCRSAVQSYQETDYVCKVREHEKKSGNYAECVRPLSEPASAAGTQA